MKSVKLIGNKDLANFYVPEANRLLFKLKQRLTDGVKSLWDGRVFGDGTSIQVSNIFGNEFVTIESPYSPVVTNEMLSPSTTFLIFLHGYSTYAIWKVSFSKTGFSIKPINFPVSYVQWDADGTPIDDPNTPNSTIKISKIDAISGGMYCLSNNFNNVHYLALPAISDTTNMPIIKAAIEQWGEYNIDAKVTEGATSNYAPSDFVTHPSTDLYELNASKSSIAFFHCSGRNNFTINTGQNTYQKDSWKESIIQTGDDPLYYYALVVDDGSGYATEQEWQDIAINETLSEQTEIQTMQSYSYEDANCAESGSASPGGAETSLHETLETGITHVIPATLGGKKAVVIKTNWSQDFKTWKKYYITERHVGWTHVYTHLRHCVIEGYVNWTSSSSHDEAYKKALSYNEHEFTYQDNDILSFGDIVVENVILETITKGIYNPHSPTEPWQNFYATVKVCSYVDPPCVATITSGHDDDDIINDDFTTYDNTTVTPWVYDYTQIDWYGEVIDKSVINYDSDGDTNFICMYLKYVKEGQSWEGPGTPAPSTYSETIKNQIWLAYCINSNLEKVMLSESTTTVIKELEDTEATTTTTGETVGYTSCQINKDIMTYTYLTTISPTERTRTIGVINISNNKLSVGYKQEWVINEDTKGEILGEIYKDFPYDDWISEAFAIGIHNYIEEG